MYLLLLVVALFGVVAAVVNEVGVSDSDMMEV